MSTRFAVPLALVVSVLPAQQVVSPIGVTNTYSGGDNAVPWGWPSPTSAQGEVFYQQIDDGLLGNVRVLKGFAFRHYYLGAVTTPWSYTASIKIGDAATNATTISTTFVNNWKNGGTVTTVFNGTIVFPPVPIYARPPSPPDAPVPFTVPHVYIGTNSLLWELYITSTTPAAAKQYHERGSTGNTMTAGLLGTGCVITGGGSAMSSAGSITASTLTDSLTNGPASAAAVLILGDAADQLGPLPLPIDLALVGSPGCFLRVNPLVNLSLTTNAGGSATFTLPYSMNPNVSGIRLRTQWAAIDSASKFRSSNGLDHCVPFHASGKPWPQNSVYQSNFGASPPATGINYVSGIVTHWML